MLQDNTQPDSAGQEAVSNPVETKLGHLDVNSLTDLLKSGFLNEEENVPATAEQEGIFEETDSSEEDVDQSEDTPDQPDEVDESTLSKGVQKRINKLVAAKKAAQAELDAQKTRLAQLEGELESAKTSTSVRQPEASEFVASLDTQKRVEEEYNRALDVILWCEDNIDGGVIPAPNGEEYELTAAEVRAMKRTAMKRKEIELPKRMQYLQSQAAAEAQVTKDFPWYANPASEEFQFTQQVLKEFPEIKRRPDHKHVLGLLALGAKAYNEQKTKKVAAPIKRAPVQPSVKASPATSSNADLIKMKQNFAKNSSSDSSGLTDLVKAMGFV
jgi:hypothetical protein